MASTFRNIGCNTFTSHFSYYYLPGDSKLDSLEAKGNHFAHISARNIAFKRINSSQISVMVQRDISPNDNFLTFKLAREAQRLASEKEKQDGKFKNYWFDKKRKLWFRLTNNPVLLKYPLFTTVHTLNHWSTNKMTAVMNQHRWGNTKKATKSIYLTCPTCLKYNPRSEKWISYNLLWLIDINMF